MKTANWWQIFTTAAILAIALTTIASAQDPTLDFAITGVEVENSKGDFRVIPQVTIASVGSQANHDLSVVLLLGELLVEESRSLIEYIQNEHTCYNYTWPNCGQGDCLTIYGWYYTITGICQDWQMFRCSCVWILWPEFQWVEYTGQLTATVIVDPFDEIAELDEDNNVMTIELAPVTTDEMTWTAVKVLYR
ncbi:MAG: hypothetical protein ABIF77_19365 [bacterium]